MNRYYISRISNFWLVHGENECGNLRYFLADGTWHSGGPVREEEKFNSFRNALRQLKTGTKERLKKIYANEACTYFISE